MALTKSEKQIEPKFDYNKNEMGKSISSVFSFLWFLLIQFGKLSWAHEFTRSHLKIFPNKICKVNNEKKVNCYGCSVAFQRLNSKKNMCSHVNIDQVKTGEKTECVVCRNFYHDWNLEEHLRSQESTERLRIKC